MGLLKSCLNLGLKTKLLVVMSVLGIAACAIYGSYLYRNSVHQTVTKAREDAQSLLERSTEMFLVSTRKFHDEFEKARTVSDEEAKKVLTDWSRTIFAVDEAVIHDHGDEKPRVRLTGDTEAYGYPPLGGANTVLKSEFEKQAAARLAAGESMIEEIDGTHLRVAVPLPAQAHVGCAECHFATVDGMKSDFGRNIVLGSLNAYVPIGAKMQEARTHALIAIVSLAITFAAMIALIQLCVNGMVIKPIRRCMRPVAAMAMGDFSHKAAGPTQYELGRMAAAINDSIDATEKAFEEVNEAARREKEAQQQREAIERKQAEEEKQRQAEAAEAERVRREEEQQRRDQEAEEDRQRAEADRRQADQLRGKVDRLLEVVNSAANGDLTRHVETDGKEAIDELARGIDRMINDLGGIIGQVAENAIQFGEGSRVIAESSQTLAAGAQTQSATVEEMNASIEELTRSIEAVRVNAREAEKVARETNDLAEKGGTAVQKSVESMELIRTSSTQIGEIIQVISEIASQTNLLALNAAIEAARAGEHGMGFAVVADEVRKLAERSNRAAGEITKLIRESTNRVEEGAQLSEETGEALKAILHAASATAARISEIATATVEQASNATEVSKAIHNVTEVTEQTAAGSEEMASSSQQLGAQATVLRDLVKRFKTSGAKA